MRRRGRRQRRRPPLGDELEKVRAHPREARVVRREEVVEFGHVRVGERPLPRVAARVLAHGEELFELLRAVRQRGDAQPRASGSGVRAGGGDCG